MHVHTHPNGCLKTKKISPRCYGFQEKNKHLLVRKKLNHSTRWELMRIEDLGAEGMWRQHNHYFTIINNAPVMAINRTEAQSYSYQNCKDVGVISQQHHLDWLVQQVGWHAGTHTSVKPKTQANASKGIGSACTAPNRPIGPRSQTFLPLINPQNAEKCTHEVPSPCPWSYFRGGGAIITFDRIYISMWLISFHSGWNYSLIHL